ncbi:MAG TPA: archaeal proteasome endopeptidase complex subunit beta [Candidatus Acidoferrales bacterium]|nr:archaeal proteasome endopeptidase complex subunit beta [Candidatus Acidoferrales bacterium]
MTNVDQYKGTTTIGIVCQDGVVLASESRVTMGNFISSKEGKKIYQIDDLVGMTIAGGVGDAQSLVRTITVEAKLYKMRYGKPMTVSAIATLLSNILNSNRYYPYFVQLMIGGFDKNASSLYSLDAVGGQIEERLAAAQGSGSPIAFGVIEDRYAENLSIQEGVDLSIRALASAMKRDSASGNDMRVVKITADGFVELSTHEIDERKSALAI